MKDLLWIKEGTEEIGVKIAEAIGECEESILECQERPGHVRIGSPVYDAIEKLEAVQYGLENIQGTLFEAQELLAKETEQKTIDKEVSAI